MIRFQLAAALLALVLATTAPAQKEVDRFVARSAEGKRLAELVERIPSVGFSGSVLAAREGKVAIACGVGFADLDDEKPNTARTLHEIASASKQFTAAAILALAEKRKLALDDSIAKHLPGVPASCRDITIRQLINHTSGIPRDRDCYGDDLKKAVRTLLEGGPKEKPGTTFAYWNYGYALLAGIVEECSGEDFATYCRKRLFNRAKMRTACFTGDRAPRNVRVAVGRSSSEKGPRSALAHPYGAFNFVYKGMGGAVCSVWDLWGWDRALRGKKVLSARSREELFRPGLASYALGWYVHAPRRRMMHQHGGAVRGFRCDIRRFPDDDACLFVLSNRDDTEIHHIPVLFELALFGEDFVMPPRPLSPGLARELAGSYAGSRSSRLVATHIDGFVRATLGGGSGGAPEVEGFIGAEDETEEKLVFYRWTDAKPLGIERDEKEKISAITLAGEKLVRGE